MEHILQGEREVKVRQAAVLVLKHIIEGSKFISMQVSAQTCYVVVYCTQMRF